MLLRQFTPADSESVVQLWQDCGLTRPWNDPHKDIERKLATQPELFLVGEEDEAVMASIMIGFDGHRGWVYYLGVSPHYQGAGHGRALMARAEQVLTEIGCPKLNLQVRVGNEDVLGFYSALGYAQDQVASLSKRLIPDV